MSATFHPDYLELDTGYVLVKRYVVSIDAARYKDAVYGNGVAHPDLSNCIITMEGGKQYLIGEPFTRVSQWFTGH